MVVADLERDRAAGRQRQRRGRKKQLPAHIDTSSFSDCSYKQFSRVFAARQGKIIDSVIYAPKKTCGLGGGKPN